MLSLELSDRLNHLPGKKGIYLENTQSGESFSFSPDRPIIAASVIKLSVLLAVFDAFENGFLDPNGIHVVKESEKLPSCGALKYLHSGLSVTNMDLATLMIILSDNTATNILIDKLGMDRINSVAEANHLQGFILRRKLFDAEASAKGLQNTVTARSAADFYRALLNEKLVSPAASRKMLSILGDQRLNGKIPFYLHSADIDTAHKTGEDEGITHDTGIIFASSPIIAVFLSEETDVPLFERFIQDASADLAGIVRR